MEGVELQLRAQQALPSNPNTYPHSLDRRLQAGDQFRESKAQLESTLNSIEDFYYSPEAGPHSGPPNCERCSKKKNDIAKAYYDYYLSNDPRAWFADYPQYKHELHRRFENPDIYSLDDIHTLFQSALSDHLKQDLCAPQPGDTAAITKFKFQTADLFNQGTRSTPEILSAYLENLPFIGLNRDTVSFILDLQDTVRPEERAQIYTQYYCTPSWDSTLAAKAFKSKYARMFKSLAPHDEVLAAMRKEAEGSQASKLAELQGKLSDIKMAQSAHLKNKKRKAEKDQRMLDREPSPRFAQCTLGGCGNEINLGQREVVECALCEWMDRKGGEGGRAIYCSVEHAEEDFEEHDRSDHRCMADRCIYYPEVGPPGDSNTSPGLCQSCLEEDIVMYFCSPACYERNFADHREQALMRRGGGRNHYETLEHFAPAEGMQVVS